QLAAGSNTLVFAGGTESIHFVNLSPIFDNVAGPLVVNGTNAPNAFNYDRGYNNLPNFLADIDNPNWGEVSVDAYEPIEFQNKTTLTLNSLATHAGSDEFNLNNSDTPTGLTGITVVGGDPTASDTLIANGTAGDDAINYAPTTGNSTITGAGPVPITF